MVREQYAGIGCRTGKEIQEQMEIADALIEGSDDEDSYTRGRAQGMKDLIHWLENTVSRPPYPKEPPHG